MTRFVLDATVWFNFARAESVELLAQGMSGRLIVGVIVRRREVKTWPRTTIHAGQPFSFDAFIAKGSVECVELTSEELARFDQVKSTDGVRRLGDGETEAFILASSRGWTLCTDDRVARERFTRLPGAPSLSGTIGLLRVLAKEGTITRTAASALLRVMRDRGSRLPDEKI